MITSSSSSSSLPLSSSSSPRQFLNVQYEKNIKAEIDIAKMERLFHVQEKIKEKYGFSCAAPYIQLWKTATTTDDKNQLIIEDLDEIPDEYFKKKNI